MSTNAIIQDDIVNPAELAADYKTSKPTALSWYHKGWIPAAVANGRVIRFSRKAVAEALAARANSNRAELAKNDHLI